MSDVHIHHEVHGTGDGVPVLFTHGFSDTGETFRATVDVLAAGRRCVTWDIRGHGRSGSPDDPAQYTVDLSIGDMLAVLDAERIDRAVLLGHSLGGYLSLELHRRHPERVAALVLASTGPGYRDDEARAGWNSMCESMADDAASPGLAHAARGILRQHDAAVLEHLADIDVPTLIIVGEKDRPFLAAAEYMARKIPGARRIVIEGAGHMPMVTQTDVFAAAIRAFLD